MKRKALKMIGLYFVVGLTVNGFSRNLADVLQGRIDAKKAKEQGIDYESTVISNFEVARKNFVKAKKMFDELYG